MKNVLVINPMLYTAPPKGGAVPRRDSIADCMIVAFCRGFVKLGCNVILVASEEYRPLIDHDYGFSIVYFNNSARRFFLRFPNGMPVLAGLKKWLIDNGSSFDLIISSELLAFHTISAARLFPDKLLIWQEIGDHHPLLYNIPSIVWHNTVVKWFISRKNIAVVPRSSAAAAFASRYCSNVTSFNIDNCVDGDLFTCSEDRHDRLICIAQLIKRKNVGYVIEQFLKYKEKYHDDRMELYIVGDGEDRATLMSMAAHEKSIVFKGHLPHSELSSILSHSKGFLLASYHEYNAVSIAESIVSCVPVLVNCKSYSTDIIRKYKLGIAKENWNEDDIYHLLENHDQYVSNCDAVRGLYINDVIAHKFLSII